MEVVNHGQLHSLQLSLDGSMSTSFEGSKDIHFLPALAAGIFQQVCSNELGQANLAKLVRRPALLHTVHHAACSSESIEFEPKSPMSNKAPHCSGSGECDIMAFWISEVCEDDVVEDR